MYELQVCSLCMRTLFGTFLVSNFKRRSLPNTKTVDRMVGPIQVYMLAYVLQRLFTMKRNKTSRG